MSTWLDPSIWRHSSHDHEALPYEIVDAANSPSVPSSFVRPTSGARSRYREKKRYIQAQGREKEKKEMRWGEVFAMQVQARGWWRPHRLQTVRLSSEAHTPGSTPSNRLFSRIQSRLTRKTKGALGRSGKLISEGQRRSLTDRRTDGQIVRNTRLYVLHCTERKIMTGEHMSLSSLPSVIEHFLFPTRPYRIL